MWCILKVLSVCSERTGLLMLQDSLQHSSVPRLLLAALYKEGRSAFITDGMIARTRSHDFTKSSRNPVGSMMRKTFPVRKKGVTASALELLLAGEF